MLTLKNVHVRYLSLDGSSVKFGKTGKDGCLLNKEMVCQALVSDEDLAKLLEISPKLSYRTETFFETYKQMGKTPPYCSKTINVVTLKQSFTYFSGLIAYENIIHPLITDGVISMQPETQVMVAGYSSANVTALKNGKDLTCDVTVGVRTWEFDGKKGSTATLKDVVIKM